MGPGMFLLFLLMLVLLFVGFLMFIGWDQDKREFNNGVCTCGGTLEYFDTNSQGGRGYHCSKCGRYVWVTYNVDKDYNTDKLKKNEKRNSTINI